MFSGNPDDLINLLLTNHYDRPMQADYGANLISLLAAGALGCGSALPQVLENPAKIRANEHEFVKHSYENHETNCTRQVYIGLNPELKLRSVVGVEHCIKVGTTEGRYFWQRYEDKDADGKFDRIDTVDVGFAWTSNIPKFVVPFSMESILEEFTMIAPYLHNHKTMRIKPTDSIVRVYHRGVGREDQFNVGHHPETYTFHQFCKKKGVKNIEFYAGFPDHSMNVIQMLVDLGFERDKPVKFKGTEIYPDEFLTELLKDLKMPKGYTETENLWVFIKGKLHGKTKEILMECIVPPLKGWESAGCNIDTGMPASIMAQMIFKKVINKPGSYSPEDIVPPSPFFKELRKRKMPVYENGKAVN